MGNSASSLPYSIGPEVSPSNRPGSYGWAIHTGTQKSDSLPVTVFKASKASLSSTPLDRRGDPQILPALHHLKKCKTLVHPNVLRTYAALDTDYPSGDSPDTSVVDPSDPTALQRAGVLTTGELIVVTERCVPLYEYLDGMAVSEANALAIAWGLHNLINALGFLHNTAKLSHGAVCPHSVYVTPSGDFKLFNFSLITPVGIEDGGGGPTPHFRHFESRVCPDDYRSPERTEGRYDLISTGPLHAMDAFGLGAFIEALYGHPAAGGKVPPQLRKALQRLRTGNVRMRPRILPLLKCPVFDSEHITARDVLDNLATTQAEEKIRFLQGLPDLLNRGVLGHDVAVHRVLPVLVGMVTALATQEGAMGQDVNRRTVLAVVQPLFIISQTHLGGDGDGDGDSENDLSEFRAHVAPVVELLFQINDRGVRGALLTRVHFLASRLTNASLNSAVFEPMCSGFSDSSAPLRELTLKSTVLLVPHLTAPNLEKLSRYLVRLQSDPETTIRTNTVIFIGKIAPHLGEVSRQKLVLPAFTRAMKDSFMPCRLAALKAVRACREYYDAKSMADKVLPAVSQHLMDGAAEVRAEAFAVVDLFLETLREESARMTVASRRDNVGDLGKGTASAPFAPAVPMASKVGEIAPTASTSAPSSSSKYLSGFGSWAASKVTSSAQARAGETAGAPAEAANPTTALKHQPPIVRKLAVPTPAPAAPPVHFASLSLSDAKIGGYGGTGAIDSGASDDGWSDNGDVDGDVGAGVDHNGFGDELLKSSESNMLSPPKWASNDEDDIFSSFDMKPKVVVGGKIGVLKKGGGKLTMLSKKKQQAGAQKLTTNKGLGGGWDDF